jgi:hypothetical protein
MNRTTFRRLAAVLAAIALLSTAAACGSNSGEGKDTTTEAVTSADQSGTVDNGAGSDQGEGNVWESLLEELEGSETLFYRDENGDIHLPDIPIPSSMN